MTSPTGPFPRAARIRQSREFRDVSRRGRRRSSEAFVVLMAPTGAPEVGSRLGLTVSRKVGNAVVRNRVKRRVREWFRADGRRAADGLDVVVIARARAAGLGTRDAWEQLSELVGSAR